MSESTLHIVADTNLFFECKLLEELPWSELADDAIVVHLTKPLLTEVDNNKKKSGRTRDRALRLFKRVREMKKAGQSETIVLEGSPSVRLRLNVSLKPVPDLAESLDYQKNDDQFLGITVRLSRDDNFERVLFLTHDINAATFADAHGIPNHLIEDHWLRPRQKTDAEKEITALETELRVFKAQEPIIEITLASPETENGSFVLKSYEAAPLTEEQIETLVDKLKRKFPVATKFPAGKPKPQDRLMVGAGLTRIVYEEPTQDEVDDYTNEAYPAWLDKCTDILKRLDVSLLEDSRWIHFEYRMSNIGSRPARNARVNFNALGDIYMIREASKENDEGDEDVTAETQLPSNVVKLPLTPKVPEGRRVKRTFNVFDNLQSLRIVQPTGILGRSSIIASRLSAPTRKAEAFYYDEWPDGSFVDKGSLTCNLWRHSSDSEQFSFKVAFDKNASDKGILIAEVHAENLTKPAIKKMPVRVEKEFLDTFKMAEKLIEFGKIKKPS